MVRGHVNRRNVASTSVAEEFLLLLEQLPQANTKGTVKNHLDRKVRENFLIGLDLRINLHEKQQKQQ